MSVRVYQLAKDLAMSNKEVIQLLLERGLKITSPSSSIPNIYASALTEELKNSTSPQTVAAGKTSAVETKTAEATTTIDKIPTVETKAIEKTTAIGKTSAIETKATKKIVASETPTVEIKAMEKTTAIGKTSTIETKAIEKTTAVGKTLVVETKAAGKTTAASKTPTVETKAIEETVAMDETPVVEMRTTEKTLPQKNKKEDHSPKSSLPHADENSSPELPTPKGKNVTLTQKIESQPSVPTPSTRCNLPAPPVPQKFKVPLPKTGLRTPQVFVRETENKTPTLPIAPVKAESQSIKAETTPKGQKVDRDKSPRPHVAPNKTTPPVKTVHHTPERKTLHVTESPLSVRPKSSSANLNEKRAAPTVHFQLPSKIQGSGLGSKSAENSGKNKEGEEKKLKALICKAPLTVRDFAQKIGLKPFQLISTLMHQGIFASMSQQIADDVAISIAEKHGFKLEIRQKSDPTKPKIEPTKVEMPKELRPRPPVVCVLGHVDHGKTTLLDTVRHSHVAAGEAGGITQHVAAYQVDYEGKKITFIDTPGHAAFSNMRERGAQLTDIAVLVVAADDGFMPQTNEALKFAQKAGIPVIVAINKIDAKGANVDRIKQQMQQHGITPEEWGGDTLCVGISALQGTHIQTLLSLILLQAEIMELKADYQCPPTGIIVESQVDIGLGIVATIILQSGTLKIGDAIVCGKEYCRVRSLFDEYAKMVKVVTPSMAVKVVGWSGIPNVGDTFEGVKDEKIAKKQAETYADQTKHYSVAPANKISDTKALFEAMELQKQKILRAIVKCDVHGTVEALVGALNTIKSDKVKLEILSSGIGAISKSDIEFAHSSGAIVVGFNVKMDNGVVPLIKNRGVNVITNNIIYELVDQVRETMAELLDYEYSENHLGTAEVRRVFELAKAVIAGCMVIDGQIIRDKPARVHRNHKVLFEGKVDSLRRQKDDQSEVRSGFECGIRMEGFSKFEVGDTIESFEMIRHRQTL